jgi:hypothetical protein
MQVARAGTDHLGTPWDALGRDDDDEEEEEEDPSADDGGMGDGGWSADDARLDDAGRTSVVPSGKGTPPEVKPRYCYSCYCNSCTVQSCKSRH